MVVHLPDGEQARQSKTGNEKLLPKAMKEASSASKLGICNE